MNEQKNMMVEDQKRFVLPQMIGMDGGDDDLADDMEGLQLSFPQIIFFCSFITVPPYFYIIYVKRPRAGRMAG